MRALSKARGGFALVDYISGTIILVATVLSVSSLNSLKSQAFNLARRRQLATFAVSNALTEAKVELDTNTDLRRRAFAMAREAGTEGWSTIKTIKAAKLGGISKDSQVLVQVRRPFAINPQQFIELRAVVSWRDDTRERNSFELATLVVGGQL